MAKSLGSSPRPAHAITLAEMNRHFDACPRCLTARNPLQHVHGGGTTERPGYCFVLINPTHRNLSTSPLYEGLRFPFIGVRAFWRVLNRGGFFSDEVLQIVEMKPWTDRTTKAVLTELKLQGIYLTNLVKCAQPNPEVPDRRTFFEDMPLFSREMLLVRPSRIVAFGQLTVSVLTGQSIRLNDYYRGIRKMGMSTEFYFRPNEGPSIPVLPNFFPTGRGSPKLAAEILRLIKRTTWPEQSERPSPRRGCSEARASFAQHPQDVNNSSNLPLM
jgi:uracil-DNA glycosylase